ncbi:hypothetical protein Pelo_4549 [Pelomyxa schiedti]|nr:hypothetical protein Pelo_4549 [Pelomyxa schiedti]
MEFREKRRSVAATLSAMPCSKCGEPLSGEVIEACDRHFHAKCFGCFGCGKRLPSEFLRVAGGAYCEQCGRKAFLQRKSLMITAALALPPEAKKPSAAAPSVPPHSTPTQYSPDTTLTTTQRSTVTSTTTSTP